MNSEPRVEPPGDVVLRVTELAGGYVRGQKVIRDITLELRRGELIGVLGANGAGKSTLLRTVSGLCRRAGGSIEFDGHSIGGLSVRRRVGLGITLVPQGYALFPGLTVEENLRTGGWRASREVQRQRLDEVLALLPRLAERRQQRLEALSGGERAMLAIGRAIMSGPRLLLLDEPSLGLSPAMRRSILEALRAKCAEGGLSAIVAEQDFATLSRIATSCHVLRNGRPVFAGTPASMTSDTLRDLYLGIGQHDPARQVRPEAESELQQ